MNSYKFCLKLIGVFSISALLMFGTKVYATEKQALVTVSGLVRDAKTQKPIAAAQISIPNKNVSAVTNELGEFNIKVTSSKDVIVISAYDYNKREIAISLDAKMIVDLYSNQFSTYFTDVAGVTGTVSNASLVPSVKALTDFSKTSALTADELLQTSLGADVRAISRSGVAGVGASLFIRGINSINANAQPLFVVDGVIWNSFNDIVSLNNGFFSNPLDNIDVNDIESVTVLKDGASIYGSKASNGVILIKTKRAKSMVTKISLNVLTGITSQPGTVPMMSGDEFRVYASEILNTKAVLGNNVSDYGFLETNRDNTKVYNINHNNTNWADEVYQTGVSNRYLINVSGGDEKAMNYVSLGYTGNSGVVNTTSLMRLNIRYNGDFKLTDNVTLGMNIDINRVERKLLDDGMDLYSSPTWISKIKSPFLSPFSYTNAGELAQDYAFADQFGVANPTGLILASINNVKKSRVNIGFSPVYKISPEITLSTHFDYNYQKDVEGKFIPMDFVPARMLDNYGLSYNKIASQVMRNIGIFDETRFAYTKKFDTSNSLKAMIGFRYIYNYYESDYIEEHNSGTNTNTTITGGYKFLNATGINNETRSLSNYLTADYNYENRYFVNFTMAMDASSRFGRNTEGGMQLFGRSWGLFPAINGAWLVSSENFMKNIKPINFAKLRMGYGITGNDGIPDYEAMAYFSSVQFTGGANGLVLSGIENSKVQWENTGKANVGVDLGLFNDRLNVTFDMFASNTSNLLLLKSLPYISGLGNYWYNGGEMTNKGFELALNYKALNLTNFKWELGLSVGHYKNKITALSVDDYTTSVYGGEVITAVGQAAGVFYGYKTNGVFATEEAATAADLKIRNTDGSFTKFGAGDMIFVDTETNGAFDKVIDEKDKQIIGDPNPDIYGTFSSKWSYKRLSLNAVFTYSYGNDIYNYYRSQLESGKDFYNQTSVMNTRWTAEGQVTTQPKAVYGDPMGNARFSDRWIEDGSYIRLKALTLAYDLPIKSKYIEGVNFWLSANNLVTFSNYLGLDPEVSAGNSVYYQGVDAGLLPLTQSYYFGVKFNL